MKRILVSGASGVVGYGILRSLRRVDKPLKLIGTTIYNDSVAQGFCDTFVQAIPTNHPDYIDWLLDVIAKHQIDLIMHGIEADLYAWLDNLERLKASGTQVLMNNPELITLCRDKWVFFDTLRRTGTPHLIDSTLDNNFDALAGRFGLPFLLKPRHGFGSKGIVRIADQSAFERHRSFIGDVLMAQPIVGHDDEEFTTAVFGDGTGGYPASMTMRRKLSKEGFTDRAEVVVLPEIDKAVSTLCKIVKPLGPTNFQFRKQNGEIKLLEINPRISSSTSIRAAFGYNESAMAVDYYLEHAPVTQPAVRQGRAVRYIEECTFYEDRSDL